MKVLQKSMGEDKGRSYKKRKPKPAETLGEVSPRRGECSQDLGAAFRTRGVLQFRWKVGSHEVMLPARVVAVVDKWLRLQRMHRVWSFGRRNGTGVIASIHLHLVEVDTIVNLNETNNQLRHS